MNKQNYKVIAIIFAILVIPSMVFASGPGESKNDHNYDYGDHDYDGDDDDDDYFSHKLGKRQFAKGAIVTNVLDASPAKLAGLQEYDIILAIDGERTRDLQTAIKNHAPGENVELTIARLPKADSDKILPEELLITITLAADENGIAFAGIEYFSGRNMGRVGRRDRFNDFTPEQLEELFELMKTWELETSSL